MMIVRIVSGVVTSRGISHAGSAVELPEVEATMLIRMGRAAPLADDAPAPQHREDSLPVVRRGRPPKQKAE